LKGQDLPELSDLIVEFVRHTFERRDVMGHAVLDALSPGRRSTARRVLAGLTGSAGTLDRLSVDAVLVRSHLELQRLHEEVHVGAMMRDLVKPMIGLAREAIRDRRPVRIVDLGCGLGFVLR
jgi:hypothetical protein